MSESNSWIVPGPRRPSRDAAQVRHGDLHEIIDVSFSRLGKVVIENNKNLQCLLSNIFFVGRTWIDKTHTCEINLGKVRSGKEHYIHLPCIKPPMIENRNDLKVEPYQNHFSIRYLCNLPITDPSKRDEIILDLDGRKYLLVLKVMNTKLKIFLLILIPTIVTLISFGLYLSGAITYLLRLFGL